MKDVLFDAPARQAAGQGRLLPGERSQAGAAPEGVAMSAISVLAIRKLDGKSAVKAFVDIRIGGVTIKSARVIQQPDRPAWLAMPSVKTERASHVVELSDALKERVSEVVLTCWDVRPAAGPSTEGHHNSTRQQRRDPHQEAIDEWAARFDARGPDQEPPF